MDLGDFTSGLSDDSGSFFNTDTIDNTNNDIQSIPDSSGSASSSSSSSGSGAGSLLSQALGLGSKAIKSSAQAANTAVNSNEYRAQKELSVLDTGTLDPKSRFENRSPIHSRNEFNSVDSVDPMRLETEWDQRLATYAGIVRNTSVRG